MRAIRERFEDVEELLYIDDYIISSALYHGILSSMLDKGLRSIEVRLDVFFSFIINEIDQIEKKNISDIQKFSCFSLFIFFFQ